MYTNLSKKKIKKKNPFMIFLLLIVKNNIFIVYSIRFIMLAMERIYSRIIEKYFLCFIVITNKKIKKKRKRNKRKNLKNL